MPTPGPSFLEKYQSWANSPSTADFAITCSGYRFDVCRAVVRLHSGYFAKLFDSDWKANKESLIDLKEDDVDAVHAMTDYFARFLYSSYVIDRLEYIQVIPGPAATEYADVPRTLLLHAKVWAIADKYDIPDLKLLACRYFERDGNFLFYSHRTYRSVRTFDDWGKKLDDRRKKPHEIVSSFPHCWFTAVEYIYEHSNPAEPGLRGSVIKVWSAVRPDHKAQLEPDEWERVVEKYPELRADLAMRLGSKQTPELWDAPRALFTDCCPRCKDW